MPATPRLKRHRLPLAVFLALAGSSAAYAASGSFTFVTGDVSVTKSNGQRVVAARGTEVDPGDSITTGALGMAQLTMVDQARLSLRPGTQFRIEQYQRQADSEEGAVLNLVRGTLRTFTGLIASRNRDRFVMKTRVATVGIRGSGNILYACQGAECDPSVTGAGTGGAGDDFTVNHTIEGSHAVSNDPGTAPGLPPQQGGAQTLITGPGQTVLIQGRQAPRYIPTPTFISDTATNPTGAPKSASTTGGGEAGAPTRTFAPGDAQQLPIAITSTTTPVGNNGLGFVTIDASNNLLSDPASLNDVVISNSSPFLGQATSDDLRLQNGLLRGYSSYPGSQSGISPSIDGGSAADSRTFSVGGVTINMGRYDGAQLGFAGPGSGATAPGGTHWIYSPSGYPTYLSEVLTGTANYTLVAGTNPTNQNGTAGTLGSATLDVNFSNRTANMNASVSIPTVGQAAGGSWTLSASNVPLTLNTFAADTGNRLVITNGTGQSSSSNSNLYGSIAGSLVGSSLQGAILGYGITDQTSSNPGNHHVVSGVAGFTGPSQNGAAAWREGRISDPAGTLGGSDLLRTFATTNRNEEVTQGANGAVTAFTAPYSNLGGHLAYNIGTASVVESGFDAETGMVWGRWGNGVATVQSGGQTSNINLQSNSLHYIFSGSQAGPVALPLTGTATYELLGATRPTDNAGHVGTLNTATLDANFSNRTVNAAVNVGINGQTWSGSAINIPIYRDQYFSAVAGPNVPPGVAVFSISCQPSCGQGASGSLDGFFAGRSGQRAGMMYNMGGVQGAAAFGRRGG